MSVIESFYKMLFILAVLIVLCSSSIIRNVTDSVNGKYCPLNRPVLSCKFNEKCLECLQAKDIFPNRQLMKLYDIKDNVWIKCIKPLNRMPMFEFSRSLWVPTVQKFRRKHWIVEVKMWEARRGSLLAVFVPSNGVLLFRFYGVMNNNSTPSPPISKALSSTHLTKLLTTHSMVTSTSISTKTLITTHSISPNTTIPKTITSKNVERSSLWVIGPVIGGLCISVICGILGGYITLRVYIFRGRNRISDIISLDTIDSGTNLNWQI